MGGSLPKHMGGCSSPSTGECGVTFLQTEWIRPRALAAACGALAMIGIGFWMLGWTTQGGADRMAQTRSEAAALAVLVPFCVAKAEHDPDPVRLTRFRADTSDWARAQAVREAGWATVTPGAETPDDALAVACSERLKKM